MDKKELETLISEKEKKATKESKKRVAIVYAALTAVCFLVFSLFEGRPEDFNEFFSYLLTSFMITGINLGIYQAVFEHLSEKDQAAEKEIKALRQELSDINAKELDELIKKYKKE